MAEENDVRLYPPMRGPKSQQAVEQPLTGGCWNPPKNYTPKYIKSKDKEAAMRWQEGHQHDKIKSHTYQVGKPQSGE